jgi:hypothetical protein
MPIAPDKMPARPTPLQNLILSLHAKLDEVLTAEGRAAPELVFGALQHDEFTQTPRVGWQHIGGHFVVGENVPTGTDTPIADPPIQQVASTTEKIVGVRRAVTQVVIWHVSAEHAEHVLDRMWLVCKRDNPDGARFRWLIAKYDFPTESVGEFLKNGASVIVVALPVDLPVPLEYDGEHPLVTVQGADLRAGITTALANDPETTEWQFNRWPG